MGLIGDILFTPWLSSQEKERVNAHSPENFEFQTYHARSSDGEFIRVKDSQAVRLFKGRVHNLTKEIFWADDASTIAMKGMMITVATIPYTALRALFHVGRAVYLFVKTIIENIRSAFTALVAGDIVSGLWDRLLVGVLCRSVVAVCEQLFEAIKCPYYGLGYGLAAMSTFLCDPLRGRARLQIIEENWNGGKENGIRASWQHRPSHFEVDAFYLAGCMQPLETDANKEVGGEAKYYVIATAPNEEEFSALTDGVRSRYIPFIPVCPQCVRSYC